MKDIKLSTISKAAGAAAGVITIASVSAWISTKYLLRMALDREEPVLLKAAEKRISGTEQDNGFIRVMQESAKHLEEKPNETISIMSYDGEQLVGHWIPVNRAKRVIIAVHGWRGSWTQTFGMVADSFEQNDCSVCLLGEAIKSGNWFDYEVPCPVKYVLEKGYCIENGFLICDAPFDCDDNDWCLDVDEEYYDYLNPPSVNESVTNTLAWKEFTRISPTLSQRLKKTPNADLSTEGILDYLWGGYSFFGNKEFLSLYEHMKQFTMENGHKANL